MRALIIVLLVLTVLLLTPLGIDGGYKGNNLVLGIRIGFLNIRFLPKRKKHTKPKIPKTKKIPKQTSEKAVGDEKSEKPFDKALLIGLIKSALKSLGRLKKKLRVDYLRIHYTFASDDPFKTAMGFGKSSAALGAIMPLVDNAFNIGERDIGTSFDFLSDKPVFDCWITTSIQVWEVFYIAIAFGIDYLKLKIKQKREARKGKE